MFKILCFILGMSFAYSQYSPIHTTRLVSTGGAGVASILAHEASVLNPASIAFIKITNAYFAKNTIKSDDKLKDFDQQLYVLSDTSSKLKGTFSYQKQDENNYSREKFVSSIAAPVSKRATMGIAYRFVKEKKPSGEKVDKHQAVIGGSYIVDKKLAIGAVLEDPFQSIKKESMTKLGLQYELFNNFTLIQDFSFHTFTSMSKSLTINSALQLMIYKDLYIRGGKFKSKYESYEGSSYGFSWIGPRLALEFAVLDKKYTKDSSFNMKDDKSRMVSMSASLTF